MNPIQKNRLYTLLAILSALGIAMGFLLYALRQNINLFYTPSSVRTIHLSQGQTLRIGGFVQEHSVHFTSDGKAVIFKVTDRHYPLLVHYQGILPTLFREGQGIVMTGTFKKPGVFEASSVLAKHDEKYRPRL